MGRPHVVIVGGGPAGSAAAVAVAAAGGEAIVLERGPRGRDKACGDALPPLAVNALASLGITSPEQVGAITVPGFRFVSTDQVEHTGSMASWVTPRCVLDQVLRDKAEAAGASVSYQTRARAVIERAAGGLDVQATTHSGEKLVLDADAVVLAHGAATRISTAWGVDGSPLRIPVITQYVEGDASDSLDFVFGPGITPGFEWDFPAPGGARNVGRFATSATGLRSDRRMVGATPGLARSGPKWRGGWANLWSGRGKQWFDPRGVVSCGDAAGVIHPYSGAGIGEAIITGRMAGYYATMYALDQRDVGHLRAFNDKLAAWGGSLYDATSPVMQSWQRLVEGPQAEVGAVLRFLAELPVALTK
jgi:flavin-dependent dehydrogenase